MESKCSLLPGSLRRPRRGATALACKPSPGFMESEVVCFCCFWDPAKQASLETPKIRAPMSEASSQIPDPQQLRHLSLNPESAGILNSILHPLDYTSPLCH